MFDIVILLLVLFQLKHFFVDFVLQTDAMVNGKGIYGNIDGVEHSIQHAVATFIIVLPFTLIGALISSVVDFILHYHIDYVKMKYGNRDITKKPFWVQLGLDQLMHQLTYILLIWILIVE